MSLYLSLQFKYTIFHILICILHLLRVYYNSWLYSSVGTLPVLQLLISFLQFKCMIFHIFICSDSGSDCGCDCDRVCSSDSDIDLIVVVIVIVIK